ncbi:hypothetical protein [Maricaulis sp.]|uniref:hypothetical protein n=1 Tax=Maricaulis sp. TaxID=1486257 RepID=UPI003A93A1BB
MSKIEAAFTEICRAVKDAPDSALALERRTGVSAGTLAAMRAGNYRPKTIQNLIAVERALAAPSQEEASPCPLP